MADGLLSMCGTPIGNLGDASPRLVETLASCDAILCEDTRVSAKLLSHFDIHVPLERCDENVLAKRTPALLERLEAGDHLGFVSDAGMPCISDPGQRLVDAALDAGIRVEVIPGPSAVDSALVVSGLSCANFFFAGFLPRKSGEQARRLEELASVPGALVFYESPHRVRASCEALASAFPARRIALVRELTKLHEEVIRGSAQEVLAQLDARDALRGECVLVVEAPGEGELRASAEPELALEDAIREGLAAGEPKSALAKRLSRTYGRERSEVYDLILELAD